MVKIYKRNCNNCGEYYEGRGEKFCSHKCYSEDRRGKRFSLQHRKRMGEVKLAEKNPNWKGNKVGYKGLHNWLHKRLPKPKLCEECKKRKPYDLANISGKYLRDLKDWKWLCRKCHMVEDGRFQKFINSSRSKGKKWKRKKN